MPDNKLKNNKSNKKKKKKKRLPRKIIPLYNVDKLWHEKWTPGRDELNIPHPFRAVIIGRPNSGKTTTILNILMRADPPYKKLYVVHCDPGYTGEYDEVNATMLDEIPDPDDSTIFDGKNKTLVVLDDLEYKFMSKQQKRNIDRLFGFVSTHKNVSVCLAAQDCFNVPPSIRRMSNFWILWRVNDLDSLYMVARKAGIMRKDFDYLMKKYIKGRHDSLWLDRTKDTPYPIRISGYNHINEISKLGIQL